MAKVDDEAHATSTMRCGDGTRPQTHIAPGAVLGITLGFGEPLGELPPGGDLELGVHVAEVVLDGLDADDQLTGGLSVTEPGGDQPGNRKLLRDEPGGVAPLSPTGPQAAGGQFPLAARK